nr:MAG TPA: hypothetical protein [Caudoviricetes sp.]
MLFKKFRRRKNKDRRDEGGGAVSARPPYTLLNITTVLYLVLFLVL